MSKQGRYIGGFYDLNITNPGNGRIVTSTGGSGLNGSSNFLINNDVLSGSSSSSGLPSILLSNSNDDASSGSIAFTKIPWLFGDPGVGDKIGELKFYGIDSGDSGLSSYPTEYGNIVVKSVNVTATDEAGSVNISAACSNGTTTALQQGFLATGHGTSNKVDIGLGYGTASVTTVAGTLTVGTTAAMTNAGLLSVAAQTNITSVGTLTGLTTSGAIELGHASDTTITRTAAGKIAVEGVGVALVSNTARQVVSLRTDDQYVIYLGSVNRWYQANRVFSSIGTQSTLDGESVTDSIAIAAASYIAIRPCTVHSVIVTWYPSQSSAIEFEILKVPLVDNSTSNVTFAQMTHTDHNASYTANTNYVKTFAITGGNTLTAGQGIALAARRTSGNATYFNAGQIYAEIEITG